VERDGGAAGAAGAAGFGCVTAEAVHSARSRPTSTLNAALRFHRAIVWCSTRERE
jgi:hypothetical protein